jgi:hypothetical protein
MSDHRTTPPPVPSHERPSHERAVPRDAAPPDRAGAIAPRSIGSLPAGLELPPRINPPNPQHPEIPQTFDPRVSVQLERSARDIAAGVPGLAAREDLERFRPDPARGAGPQPLPPRARDANAPEGIPPRETPVTFNQQFASYYAGETAAFTEDEAARLADLGVTGDAGGGATAPPANVDVPHVTQDDAVLNCTMGNWQGTPTAYAYQWQRGGVDIGDGTTPYTVTPADVGTTVTCIVTATNANGSTAAPPSNGVVVTEPSAGDALHETRRRGR